MTTLNTKIKFRNDLSTNWETLNPILLKGEPGYDTQKKIFKVGDGVTPWNALESIAAERESEITTYNYPYPGGTLTNGVSAGTSPNKALADTDIIWALGTNFGTTAFMNPTTSSVSSRISITRFPVGASDYTSRLVDRSQGETNYYHSETGATQHLTFDFNTLTVKPTHFAYQQRTGTYSTYLTSDIKFQVSTDNVNYNTIVNATLSPVYGGWNIVQLPLISEYYRYIRFLDENVTWLMCTEILFWGSLR